MNKGEQLLEINKIYCGDCLELMKEIPDKSIDLVLTDPPYNISNNFYLDRSKMRSPIMRRDKPINYEFGDWDKRDRKDFLKFTRQWLNECGRILKDNGTIISFFNKEDISFLCLYGKKDKIRTRTIFTWHKTNPVPSFRKVNYLSACEFIWIGSRGKSWTFNFGNQKDMHNFFETANSSSYKETNHPTEKPVKLIKHFIEIHSNENDLILDPFVGSGTTCIASMELKRNFIGIEISQEYVDIANKRIADYKQQLKLEIK